MRDTTVFADDARAGHDTHHRTKTIEDIEKEHGKHTHPEIRPENKIERELAEQGGWRWRQTEDVIWYLGNAKRDAYERYDNDAWQQTATKTHGKKGACQD